MNSDDNNEKWLNLLAHSAPTFGGEATPPYGFITNTLASLRAARSQQQEFERIGWRALLASLAALVVAAALTLTVDLRDRSTDFDPGVRSLVQVDDLPYS